MENNKKQILEEIKRFKEVSKQNVDEGLLDDITDYLKSAWNSKPVEKVKDFFKDIVSGKKDGDSKETKSKIKDTTSKDDDFYREILNCIDAPDTKNNMQFFYAWRQAESGTAKFNPFNTTYKISNDTGMCYYNCLKDGKGYQEIDCKTCPKGTNPGVKSYSTSQYGLEATVSTLRSKKYACIVGFLRKGDVAPEKIANDCLSELETWGTGEGVAKVLGGKKIDPPPIEGIS